jgi:hypothetical protein
MIYLNDRKKTKTKERVKIILNTGNDSTRENMNSLQAERIDPPSENIKEKYS